MPTRNTPNILFVFADQLRRSSVGYAGEEPVLTPNIDAFAAQGISFTHAVANSPLCCPMRASLITGLYPLSHGVVSNDILLRTDAPCIAKSLKGAGYRTGYIGKWHLDGSDRGCFTPPGSRRQGFDFWAAANCNHSYFESFYYRDTPEPIWIDGYEPTTQTDIAIDYLRDASARDERFCLFLSWGPPHCPYHEVPDRFRRLYDPARIAPRANAQDPNMRVIAGYYAHITALDWNFGRLMAAVDELGLAEDTLVIFTSDHGDMLFSQGKGWKCKPWNESVSVPFAARWPGVIPAGATEDAPFGLVNVTPTLLSVCGAQVPAEMEGEAYPEMLLGAEGPRPQSTPIYLHLRASYPATPPVWRGVVTAQHTYARTHAGPWVLYDDARDPYQFDNLAADAESGELLERMEAELNRWMEFMGDRFESEEELAVRLGIECDIFPLPRCYYQPEMLEEMHRRTATRADRMAKA